MQFLHRTVNVQTSRKDLLINALNLETERHSLIHAADKSSRGVANIVENSCANKVYLTKRGLYTKYAVT